MAFPCQMGAPICLVENTNDGKFVTRPDALKILASLNEPMVVVSMVGKYGTGKSYLLNRIANGNGFAVGSTAEAHTKGIWMWCVPHPRKQHHRLLLLDTEGLGNVESDVAEIDTWICALAVLFSTVLVFNSMDIIDQSTLQRFHNAMNLVTVIKEQIRASGKYEDHSRFVPHFVWVVRDFTLDLNINGNTVTSDQYLEYSLGGKEGSKETTAYNVHRDTFRNSFLNRKCFMLVYPSTKRKRRHQEQDLDEEFIAECQKLCNYVYGVNPIKAFSGGNQSSGETLSTLVENCISLWNRGLISPNKSVPPWPQDKNLKAAEPPRATSSDSQSDRNINKMQDLHGTGGQYQSTLDRHDKVPRTDMSACKKTYNTEEYKRGMEREESKERFLREPQYSQPRTGNSYTAKVNTPRPCDTKGQNQDSLQGHDPKHYEQNKESTDRCKNLLKSLSKSVDDKLKAGDYAVIGGYQRYVCDRNEMVRRYRTDAGNEIQANEVLEKYLKEKMIESEMVQLMDKFIADKEREITALKQLLAFSEQEKRTLSQKLEETNSY
uniref:guanylate-binding protein 1-like isoform X1 n=2 Tax=Pristiophorus japonicus TaxID=55135 RepID=UPI00398E84AA